MQNCRTSQQAQSQAENGRRKAAWNKSEESVVRSRTKAQNELFELAKKSPTTEIEARNLADMRAIEAAQREVESVTVDMMQLKPGEFSKLQNDLARRLGVHMNFLGLGDDLTQAGAVKMALVDMKRHAQGLVDVVGRWGSMGGQREAVKRAQDELLKVGLKVGDADEFINNVIEVSTHPRARIAYGNTPANELHMSRRYNAMRDEAKRLGLPDSALDNIMEAANEAATTWDKMRVIGNVLGQNINPLENIGYAQRQLTERAKRFFDLKGIDTNVIENVGVGTTPMAKSRSTWVLTPTDMQALSEVLTGSGVKSWDDKVKELLKAKGIEDTFVTAANGTKVNAVDAGIDAVFQARQQLKQAKEALKGGAISRSEAVDFARELKRAKQELSVSRKVAASNKSGSNVLSYSDILEKNGGKDADAIKQIADSLGMSVDDLNDVRLTHNNAVNEEFNKLSELWDDGLAFTEHLNKNVSADKLDDLVDAGILSKIPMTTREVYDYMSRQYELPWTKKGVQDLFEMGIEKRTENYRELLREAAGQSNIVKNLVSNGVEKGWAVPTSGLLPEHAKFKDLSGIDLTRFGLDPKIAESWGGMHVHPTVYDQLQAQLTMMTKPGVLSVIGQVLAYANKNFNILTLGGNGVPFLSRNIYGNMRVGMAAGMNPLRAPMSMHEVAAVLANGLDALDDVDDFAREGGKWITKREAFKQFMIRNGSSYVGAESGQAIGMGVKMNPAKRVVTFALDVGASLPRALYEMKEYAAMHPDFLSGLYGAAKLGTKQFDQYVSKVFAPVAYGNALSDMAMQWATFTSIMEVKGVQDNVRKGLQVISDTHSFDNMDDAFKHMRNYFIDHASLGTIPLFIAKFIKPFGTFAMISPGLALRHAVRNPAQFVAYSRLVRLQAENAQKDPDMREAGFSEFELADMPITLFKDTDGKSILSLSPTSWDSFHGAAAYGLTQAQRISRLMGSKSMTFGSQDRKELQGDKYSFTDFIGDNIRENNNPIFAAVAELIGGKDRLKRDIDKVPMEVGGASVDPVAGWFLSKLPAFSSFNRNFGGRGRVVDSNGKELSPAQPGIFATPQRDATSAETSNYQTDQRLGAEQGRLLRDFLGLNVKTIDLAKGRQHTLSDVRLTIKSLDAQARKLYDTVEPSPKRTKDIELLQNQSLQLSVDAFRVQKWMKGKNVPEQEALAEMKKLGIRVRSVPVTTPELDGFIKRSFTVGAPPQAPSTP